MIPPIPTRTELAAMLAEPPRWLAEASAGLTAAQLDATPFAGKWSCRQHLRHIAEAALGWSDILYRAVRPHRPQAGAYDPAWKTGLDALLADGSPQSAVAALRCGNAEVAAWILRLSDADVLHAFPGVLWLADNNMTVVVADSGRWGLYLHPYHHLAHVQRLRVAVGCPLPGLERFLVRCPGLDPTGPWPPWAATGAKA